MAVLSQQQGHSNLANLCRMVRNTSDDSVVVHLLAALREDPTGVNDPHTSAIMKKIRKGNEIQFRQMFPVSRLVFEAVLAELSPFLNDGTSRNHQQNIPARLKLGVALYYMAHGGDAIHLEAASGLSKATALKYVHEVAELIWTHLTQQWMGEALLEEDGYMDGCREIYGWVQKHTGVFYSRSNLPILISNVIKCASEPSAPPPPCLSTRRQTQNRRRRRSMTGSVPIRAVVTAAVGLFAPPLCSTWRRSVAAARPIGGAAGGGAKPALRNDGADWGGTRVTALA